jgi:hypothetical protein
MVIKKLLLDMAQNFRRCGALMEPDVRIAPSAFKCAMACAGAKGFSEPLLKK